MYSRTGPFIPRGDKAFRSFAAQFAKNIMAQYAAYGLTEAEAAWIMQQFVRFDKAYMIASSPGTRTRPTIADKDDARAQLRFTIRSYAAHIRANKGITDGNKIAIGVRPDNTAHTRRTCPTACPILDYIGSLPGMDQLVYRHSNTPNSNAKPYGAERLELWVAYSLPGAPKPKKEDALLVGSFKKSKMLVPHDPKRDLRLDASGPGTGLPTYWARWVGYDNETGPWSLACCTTITAKAKQEQMIEKQTAKPVAAPANDDQSMKMAA